MSDTVEMIGTSLVQHGNFNDRVYLMKLAEDDLPSIIGDLNTLASDNGYSKIIAKVPCTAIKTFAKDEYIIEAVIPQLYSGLDAAFVAKYLSDSRRDPANSNAASSIAGDCTDPSALGRKRELPQDFAFRICESQDSAAMAAEYRKIFCTYPFPIHDHRYIEKTMADNVIYFGVWHKDRLVALSSAEMDVAQQNAEMTDFATLQEYRGMGLATYLLQQMESEMKQRNIKTLYTIARTGSRAMNLVFASAHYEYGGTLGKNTNICGQLESMNVWYKALG
ncbi:MAG: putative beta-lysine N-acetyltransferase [Firmicutes bacterium]|nr:putative beta-lysine N-acetyltransferase [Bacillota bacterium]